MSRRLAYWLAAVLVGISSSFGLAQQPAPKPGGYIVQHDSEVAANEPGPHKGRRQTIGHSFFTRRTGPQARVSQARAQARIGDRIPRPAGRRDLLRAERTRRDDARRQASGRRSRHGNSHAHRQLARPEADRGRRPGDHHQLRTVRSRFESPKVRHGPGPSTLELASLDPCVVPCSPVTARIIPSDLLMM